jgi:hypothetical protein
MEKSRELEELTLLFYRALTSADHPLYSNHISQQDGVVVVGSDPKEWYEGYEAVTESLRVLTEGLQGCEILNAAPRGYREGKVGWISDRFTLRLPHGKEVPYRMTATFIQENGVWKLVQWHDSIGVPDEIAFDLTTD